MALIKKNKINKLSSNLSKLNTFKMSDNVTVKFPTYDHEMQVSKLLLSMNSDKLSELIRKSGKKNCIILRDTKAESFRWLLNYMVNPSEANLPTFYTAFDYFSISRQFGIDDATKLSGNELVKIWAAYTIPEIYRHALANNDKPILKICDQIFYQIIKEPYLRKITSSGLSRKIIEHLLHFKPPVYMQRRNSVIDSGYASSDTEEVSNSDNTSSDLWSPISDAKTSHFENNDLSNSKSPNSQDLNLSQTSSKSSIVNDNETVIGRFRVSPSKYVNNLVSIIGRFQVTKVQEEEKCPGFPFGNSISSDDCGLNADKLDLSPEDAENLFHTIGAWAMREISDEHNPLTFVSEELPSNYLEELVSSFTPGSDLFDMAMFDKAFKTIENIKTKRVFFSSSAKKDVTASHLRRCLEQFVSLFDFSIFSWESFETIACLYPIFSKREMDIIRFKILSKFAVTEIGTVPQCTGIRKYMSSYNFGNLLCEDAELSTHLKSSKYCRKEFQDKFGCYSEAINPCQSFSSVSKVLLLN